MTIIQRLIILVEISVLYAKPAAGGFCPSFVVLLYFVLVFFTREKLQNQKVGFPSFLLGKKKVCARV